jgi:hypothetical protein
MERLNPETPATYIPTDASLIRQGFLLEGQTLEQILKRDKEALNILGYTQVEVADLFAPICELALTSDKKFDYYFKNKKIFEFKIDRHRGQPCPWGCRFDLKKYPSSINFYATEIGKDETMRIPGLLRHLIEKHGFFEGGSYRVAPELIVEMFGIERIPGSIERAKLLSITQ